MGFAATIAADDRPTVGVPASARENQSAIEVILFLAAFAIFVIFGLHGMTDAKYSMLVSENLLHHHSFAIQDGTIPRMLPSANPEYKPNGYPYQMEVSRGKVLYAYPIGSSILSLPFVAFMNVFGISALTPDGVYDEAGEEILQEALAALLMAVLTIIFFRTALLMLPLFWSTVLAVGGVFSTQIWSTASRVLWSHTWEIFLLGIAIYLLAAEEERQDRGRPILLATLLAWAYYQLDSDRSDRHLPADLSTRRIYRSRKNRSRLDVHVHAVLLESLGSASAELLPFPFESNAFGRSDRGQPDKPITRIVRLRSRSIIRSAVGCLLLAHSSASSPGTSFTLRHCVSYARGFDRSELVGRSLLRSTSDDRYHSMVLSAGSPWLSKLALGSPFQIEILRDGFRTSDLDHRSCN